MQEQNENFFKTVGSRELAGRKRLQRLNITSSFRVRATARPRCPASPQDEKKPQQCRLLFSAPPCLTLRTTHRVIAARSQTKQEATRRD
jgi:hypothetical protein